MKQSINFKKEKSGKLSTGMLKFGMGEIQKKECENKENQIKFR